MQPINEWLVQSGGLADRLRILRRTAGLDQTQLARAIGTSQAKISRIESGFRLPTVPEVRAWTRATDPTAADELLTLVEEGEVIDRRWRKRLQEGATVQAQYDTLVRSATRIRNCQVLIVPGLLQTRDYARAHLLRAHQLNQTDASGIEDVVDVRMRRQEALYDQSKTFEFYFSAAALAYWPCPAQVMAGQLDRLLTASYMPNVTIGIIPPGVELEVVPAVAILVADDVVVEETPGNERTLRGDDATLYHRYADGLMAEAVTGEEARRLIAEAAAALR